MEERRGKRWNPDAIAAKRIICSKLYETAKEAANQTGARKKENINSLDWEYGSVVMVLNGMEKLSQGKMRIQRGGHQRR